MRSNSPTPTTLRLRLQQCALGFVFLWFLIGGIAHFAATTLEMSIVPPYIPWPRQTVLMTGVLELLGAAGLLLRPLRRVAGLGLFLLTLLVTPANIYMLQHPQWFAVPYWALVARMPLQLVLLGLIWWSSTLGMHDWPMGFNAGVRERRL